MRQVRKVFCVAWLSGFLLSVSGGDASGRIVEEWPYARLVAASDLVVIVQVISTGDAKKSDKPPKGYEKEFIGVDTRFRVLSVLKGEYKRKEFTLFHFRERPPKGPGPTICKDGPFLVAFGGPAAKKHDFLLFLKKRADGRYACVSGQVDPLLSVRAIQNP